MGLPNPLDSNSLATRVLTDRGIRQALDAKLLHIDPPLSDSDTVRIQPATLDVKMEFVNDSEPIETPSMRDTWPGPYTLPTHDQSSIALTERMTFYSGDNPDNGLWLSPMVEARSSLRQFGIFSGTCGAVFSSERFVHPKGKLRGEHGGFDGNAIELGNYGPNDVHFQEGSRIAQIFFRVNPFRDTQPNFYEIQNPPPPTKTGELVRDLDMGVAVETGAQIRALRNKGLFEVDGKFATRGGYLLVHATDTAYRLKTVEGGIDFENRDKYKREDLLEPIDISKGYTLKPFEHVVFITQNLSLSPNIGIQFWDNLADYELSGFQPHLRDPESVMRNVDITFLRDGWVDPNYQGPFSRQPKWLPVKTKRTVHPGDVIGFGQVFYFPNGTQRPYGDATLGSQYQGRQRTAFGGS